MTDPTPPPMPPPLPPLAYGYAPPPRPKDNSIIWRFLLGLGIGSVVSAIVWIWGYKPITDAGTWPVLMIPIVKIVLGLGFIFVPRWRSFGAGILVSLALGVMIFGGMAIHSFAETVKQAAKTSSSSSSGNMCKFSGDSGTYTPYPTTQPTDSASQPATSQP